MHSLFVRTLYFKEFQESTVNVKNSSVTTAHCSPQEQWVKLKVPAIESHAELFLQSSGTQDFCPGMDKTSKVRAESSGGKEAQTPWTKLQQCQLFQ